MSLNYDEIVRTGLARQVAETIRSAILEGRLKVDQRLPNEEELARRFGVSRPTVREALKRLAAQNLIRSRRGPAGGNFVTRPDPEGVGQAIAGAATLLVGLGAFEVDEIIAARMETEAACCRMAAVNRAEKDLEAMAAEIALQRREDLSDEDFCASDVRFHRALVDATANGPLRLMMYTVIESFIPVTNMLIYRHRVRRSAVDAHERIMRAIEARDGEGAAVLMREHLEGMRGVLAEALERRGGGTGTQA
ncbi:FadR/GntR family transcriptional regulator [Chelativorans sp. AA-79]|uniref:FadR/GntR family transcriptional regulator n=1 Tax=Chelativorans sp. AA-79 TaxID=3028735 RepID=UPI0023F9D0F1|nr:FadR/GntR family transcriptional regulator [Chelativorans sp. AA-79]WEX11150.1 FadR/GntR family transcriptional regulator [Chelativorans sp. AA-79]